MATPLKTLNAEKASIFRIAHRSNVPWILDHGLRCKNATIRDPNYIEIGNPDLIQKRTDRALPIAPKGTLSDFVPFYFTPFSPMMYNIHTGYGGIVKRRNDEIVIFKTSLHKLQANGVKFIFSDRHAFLATAQFSADLADLDRIDWAILQNRSFRRDPDDPGKVERYQAEALVHRHLPLESLDGIVCNSELVEADLKNEIASRGLTLTTAQKPSWYF
jgi:ssDNA thymidine ADP-ribosyltransferase, DarT